MKFSRFFILIAFFTLASCSDDDQIIFEPAGEAFYFVQNQSAQPIIVMLETGASLGSETVTSNIIPAGDFALVLKDGIIGVNPTPEDSMQQISFFATDDFTSPLLTFSPVSNEDWTVAETVPYESGLNLTVYDIVFTD